MKRFGLKAIAAALALTMVASLGVPATAKAEEKGVLLIAPSPKAGSVLEITQSMVDSEGELVLSGENFDKVVIPNDVEVKRLYVDGGKIGELTIESGNNPEIQIWDTQITNVNVVPAELIDINQSVGEYLDVLRTVKEEDRAAYDVVGFVRQLHAKNTALSTEAPEIVLMGADMESSTQKIENLNLSANATLNCTEGKMPVALNVNLEGGKLDANVTVKGYIGDMNVNQNSSADKAFGILKLNVVESVLGTVNMAATGNANIVLASPDSVVDTVKYATAGDGSLRSMVSLDIPAANVVTTEEAKNVDISLLTSVEMVDIAGDKVGLTIGSLASVYEATIGGTNNAITGSGQLEECTIAEGATATVVVAGADVAGNNSYVPPIAAPFIPKPEPEVKIELENIWSKTGVTIDGNKVKYTANYEPAAYKVPADKQANVATVKVKVKADSQICISVVDPDGNCLNDLSGYGGDYFHWGDGATMSDTMEKTYNVKGATVSQIRFHAGQIGNGASATNIEVVDIELVYAEEGGEGEGGEGSVSSIELKPLYGDAAVVIDGNKATIDGQYKSAYYEVPSSVDGSKIASIDIKASTDQEMFFKIVGPDGKPLVGPDGKNMEPWFGPSSTTLHVDIPEGSTVKQIEFMTLVTTTTTLTVEDVVFNVKEEPVIELKPLYGDAAVVIDGNKATIGGQYKSAYYEVPSSVDGSKIASIDIKASTDQEMFFKIIGTDGKPLVGPDGKNMEPWFGPNSTTLHVDIPEGNTVKQIEFMTLVTTTTTLTVEEVVFN